MALRWPLAACSQSPPTRRGRGLLRLWAIRASMLVPCAATMPRLSSGGLRFHEFAGVKLAELLRLPLAACFFALLQRGGADPRWVCGSERPGCCSM